MHKTVAELSAALRALDRARANLELAKQRVRRAREARDTTLARRVEAGDSPHMLGPEFGITGAAVYAMLSKRRVKAA
jgi:hypothetical protein